MSTTTDGVGRSVGLWPRSSSLYMSSFKRWDGSPDHLTLLWLPRRQLLGGFSESFGWLWFWCFLKSGGKNRMKDIGIVIRNNRNISWFWNCNHSLSLFASWSMCFSPCRRRFERYRLVESTRLASMLGFVIRQFLWKPRFGGDCTRKGHIRRLKRIDSAQSPFFLSAFPLPFCTLHLLDRCLLCVFI